MAVTWRKAWEKAAVLAKPNSAETCAMGMPRPSRCIACTIRARCRPVQGSRRTGVVSYGTRWECLREAYAGQGEDLALIEAPAAAAPDLDRWVLHPALLDIATSFGFFHAEGSFLPLAYGRVRVLDRLPERFYSHLQYGESGTPGLLSAAVTLVDPDGRVLVEITDLIFAVDSIPAIFAITEDPFIVLTSNVFAVLGLRALFFLLAGMAERFHLLAYGLAFVLMFIGGKMLLADFWKIPILASLGVVAAMLVASMLLSLWIPTRKTAAEGA